MKKIESSVRDVTYGEGVTIIEPSNLYECHLGDNVFIGPFVEVQKGVTIGARVLKCNLTVLSVN